MNANSVKENEKGLFEIKAVDPAKVPKARSKGEIKWPVKGKVNKYGFLRISKPVAESLGLTLNPKAPPMFEKEIPVELDLDKERSLIVKVMEHA